MGKLELRNDSGGLRHYLDGRPVHAGSLVELGLHSASAIDANGNRLGEVWLAGRYEWTCLKEDPPLFYCTLASGSKVSWPLPEHAPLRWSSQPKKLALIKSRTPLCGWCSAPVPPGEQDFCCNVCYAACNLDQFGEVSGKKLAGELGVDFRNVLSTQRSGPWFCRECGARPVRKRREICSDCQMVSELSC